MDSCHHQHRLLYSWLTCLCEDRILYPRWTIHMTLNKESMYILCRRQRGRSQAWTRQKQSAHFIIPHVPEGIQPRMRSRVSRRGGTTVSRIISRLKRRKIVYTSRLPKPPRPAASKSEDHTMVGVERSDSIRALHHKNM